MNNPAIMALGGLRVVPQLPAHDLAWRRAIYSTNCDFNRVLNWMCDDHSTPAAISHLFRIEKHAREALIDFFGGND